MKIVVLFLLIGLGFFTLESCTEPSKPTAPTITFEEFKLSDAMQALYKTVGEKHDVAMLLMKDIELLRSKLRIQLKTTDDEAKKERILNLLTALKKADNGMMTWMHEFKNTDLNEDEYKAMTETEIETYLKSEEVKIEQVHQDMLQSIKNGKAYFTDNLIH